MNNRRLTIWCNNEFTAEQQPERDLLAEGIGPHRLLMFAPDDNGRDGEAHKALQIAEIAFGAPDARAVCESPNVRWVHLNSAGYTSFDHQDIKRTLTTRGAMVTNSSDVYAEPGSPTLGRAQLFHHAASRRWPPDRKRETGQALPRQSATLRTRRGHAQSSHLRKSSFSRTCRSLPLA